MNENTINCRKFVIFGIAHATPLPTQEMIVMEMSYERADDGSVAGI